MAIQRRYASARSPEELVERAKERVDAAAASGERDVLGRVAGDRMVFRCRPGGVRNFAEPLMVARLERGPEGKTWVSVRVGMRRSVLWLVAAWMGGAVLSVPGLALRWGLVGSLYGLGFAVVGASVLAGCVLLERPKVDRLLHLSDEIFSEG